MKTTNRNTIENGKNVFAAGQHEVSAAKCKQHAETSANEQPTKADTIEGRLYKVLQTVETETAKPCISFSELKKASQEGRTLADIIGTYETQKAEIEKANKAKLFAAFRQWYKEQNGTEFDEFRKKFWSRARNTRLFSETFQEERTDETSATYDDGAYFGRPTSYTAAGLRTSFNSAELCKNALQRMKKRQQKAEKDATKLAAVEALKAQGFTEAQIKLLGF